MRPNRTHKHTNIYCFVRTGTCLDSPTCHQTKPQHQVHRRKNYAFSVIYLLLPTLVDMTHARTRNGNRPCSAAKPRQGEKLVRTEGHTCERSFAVTTRALRLAPPEPLFHLTCPSHPCPCSNRDVFTAATPARRGNETGHRGSTASKQREPLERRNSNGLFRFHRPTKAHPRPTQHFQGRRGVGVRPRYQCQTHFMGVRAHRHTRTWHFSCRTHRSVWRKTK